MLFFRFTLKSSSFRAVGEWYRQWDVGQYLVAVWRKNRAGKYQSDLQVILYFHVDSQSWSEWENCLGTDIYSTISNEVQNITGFFPDNVSVNVKEELLVYFQQN